MYVTWPWFIAIVFFSVLAFCWNAFDKSWLSGRIDDVEDLNDRRHDATNDRLERVEEWIKVIDPRARHLPAVEPETEEIDEAPATQPDNIAIQVQSALLHPNPAGPRELMSLDAAERQRAERVAFVEEQLARFDFSGRSK